MFVRQVTFVLATLLLLSSEAQAAGLTADDVAKHASATSPTIDEKRRDIEAAEAQRDKAFTDFFPRVGLSASYFRLSPVTNPSLGQLVVAPGASEGPLPAGTQLAAVPLQIPVLENSTSLTANLTIPLSDYVFRLVQANDGAKAQLRASVQTLRAQERKTAYEARALYYQWVRAELEARVAEQNLQLSREHLAQMKILAAADSASEADVARVEASLAAAELAAVQQRNVARLEHERIEIVMHGNASNEIGEDLARVRADGPTNIDALVAGAQQRRPEIVAAGASIVASEKQVDLARAGALPRLDAIGSATAANPNQRRFPQTQDFHTTWQLGVQLTYAPNDTATSLSQTAAARAKAAAAEARRRQLLDAVRSEVVEAVITQQNAEASVETSARRLAAAETSYKARYERFRADKATTVELTDAQTELFRARLDAVSAQVATKVAKVRLAYATGTP